MAMEVDAPDIVILYYFVVFLDIVVYLMVEELCRPYGFVRVVAIAIAI